MSGDSCLGWGLSNTQALWSGDGKSQGLRDGQWGAWSGWFKVEIKLCDMINERDSPTEAKENIKAGLRRDWLKDRKMKEQNVCWSCILSFFRAFLASSCLWTKMLNSTKTARKAVWQSFHSLKKQQHLINSSRVTDLSKAEKNWPLSHVIHWGQFEQYLKY